MFTVSAGPIHPLLPLYYRWLRNGQLWASNLFPDLVITNCQSNGTYRLVVGNLAGTTLSVPAGGVALTVLRDFDGDGMADSWETNYPGFSTNNAADALLDFDGDGMINRDEYRAGTNPTNAASVLKLQMALDAGGQAALSFLALSNRTYTVEWNTQVIGVTWNRLQDVLAQPADRLGSATDTNAAGPTRFYRVVTPKRP